MLCAYFLITESTWPFGPVAAGAGIDFFDESGTLPIVESDIVPDESLVTFIFDESEADEELFPLHAAKHTAMHKQAINILALFI